jgi:hypothetical protein
MNLCQCCFTRDLHVEFEEFQRILGEFDWLNVPWTGTCERCLDLNIPVMPEGCLAIYRSRHPAPEETK